MDCGRFAMDDAAERYLLGRLTEAEVEEFESHYFQCDECFATVEALRAAKVQLEMEQESVPRIAERPRPTVRWWLALSAAVVATLAVVVLIVRTLGSSP